MTASATELIPVTPDYAICQAHDRNVKADLFSTAVRVGSGVVVVDPITLTDHARAQLAAMGNIAAVLVTNANHGRAAAFFGRANSIFAPRELQPCFAAAQILSDGMQVHGLTALALNGGAPGEFAFHDPRDGGTVVVGDTLINFEPHGFTLLPAKYCTDQKRLVRSLRRLLDFPFQRLFFAHGVPITRGAKERLTALLEEFS